MWIIVIELILRVAIYKPIPLLNLSLLTDENICVDSTTDNWISFVSESTLMILLHWLQVCASITMALVIAFVISRGVSVFAPSCCRISSANGLQQSNPFEGIT